MTLGELIDIVASLGYSIRETRGGGFEITGPDSGRFGTFDEVLRFFLDKGILVEDGAEEPTPPPDAPAKPDWWPEGQPWPPTKTVRTGTDDFGDPIFGQVFDNDVFNAVRRESRLGQEEPPQEQFLGTISEGGWDIDQFGFIDENGEQVITRRQPRQPIQDPILSLNQQIAGLLEGAATLNMSDPDFARAVALQDFQNRPTDAERLRIALDLAQSPSDYLTLVGLYTGAITRETAQPGERIAPVAQFLQDAARKFFLDIQDVPGISEIVANDPDALARGNLTPEEFTKLTPEQQTEARAISAAGGPEGRARQQREQEQAAIEAEGQARIDAALEDFRERSRAAGIAEAAIEEVVAAKRLPSEAQQETFGDPAARAAFSAAKGLPQQPVEGITQAEFDKMPDPANEAEAAKKKKGLPYQTVHGFSFVPTIKKAPSITEPTAAAPTGRPTPSVAAAPTAAPQRPVPAIVEGRVAAVDGQARPAPSLLGEGFFGETLQVPKPALPAFLTAPSTVSIPSLTGIPFRSAQTRRGQSPTARRLFQSLVEQSGVPFEDFQQQEERATSIGGPRRRRSQFRRTPSLV